MSTTEAQVIGYFDSSLIPHGGTSSPTPAMGYVTTQSGAIPSAWYPVTAAAATADLAMVTPEFHWTFNDQAVIRGGLTSITGSPAERGTQLWDILASRCTLESIRSTGYAGSVTLYGDGLDVIRFMSSVTNSLTIQVASTNVAPLLRSDVLALAAHFSRVEWRWIPRYVNPADRVLHTVKHDARRNPYCRASAFRTWSRYRIEPGEFLSQRNTLRSSAEV